MGSLPAGDDWAFEIKWDGYRTLVHVADGDVRLQSTAGHDVTARWPEFGPLASAVNASDAILDGELVVFDDDGHPSFELVQNSGVGTPRQAVLQLFDVLAVGGIDTVDLAYEDRRRLLEQLVEPGPNWTIPANRVGDGEALLEATRRAGTRGRHRQTARIDLPTGQAHQGLAQDQEPSPCRADHRRIHRRRRQPHPARSARCSSVGRSTGTDTLTFAGGVGTGFKHATLESLTARLGASAPTCAPSIPHLRPRTAAVPPGSNRSSRQPSRSPSSPTKASSAMPASSSWCDRRPTCNAGVRHQALQLSARVTAA